MLGVNLEESEKKASNKGRPKKPGGAIPSAKRQAAYRQKKLEEGVEISIFLRHNQVEILRQKAITSKKTQSEVVGELLEQSTKE